MHAHTQGEQRVVSHAVSHTFIFADRMLVWYCLHYGSEVRPAECSLPCDFSHLQLSQHDPVIREDSFLGTKL